MSTKRRWTQEEDTILVQTISSGSYNLSKCFISVATQINRDPRGVKQRWYKHVRFTSEGRKTMLTIGEDSSYTGKNFVPNGKVRPLENKIDTSLWNRLLKVLRLK